jgi:hypothetical protein
MSAVESSYKFRRQKSSRQERRDVKICNIDNRTL